MRMLVIDEHARAEVARVRKHAEQERNYYHDGDPSPGDDPAFVTYLSTYRCVFTLTDHEGILWRHLSISVPAEKYPNPIATFMIAQLFGFTGWDDSAETIPDDWEVRLDETDQVVIMGQPVKTTAKLTS